MRRSRPKRQIFLCEMPSRRCSGWNMLIGHSRGRLVSAVSSLFVVALFAVAIVQAGQPQAQQEKSRWLATSDGCLVWDLIPMPGETVTWSGACVDGKASGYGTRVFRYRENGMWKEQRYVGEMQRGKTHGQGTFQDDDGSRYDGHFSDGKQNGHGVLIDAKGNRYEGEFRDGSQTHGKWIFTNGTQYEGDLENGQFHGTGTYTFPNGARYVGSFRNGLPNGYGTLTRYGETVSGNWSNGCFRGGGRIAAVGVPEEQCGASPTAPPADHLIVPGQRIGPLMLGGTIGDITKLFGPGTEKGPSPWPGQGAVLHTWDTAGVWVISDKASGNILWISIEPNKFEQWDRYATTDGLRIGIGESEIVGALGKSERTLDEGGMRSLYYDGRGIR